jgi:tellurite resistance protein
MRDSGFMADILGPLIKTIRLAVGCAREAEARSLRRDTLELKVLCNACRAIARAADRLDRPARAAGFGVGSCGAVVR